MKSRISIEVDFENNNQPVIQILESYSDDVRDKLLSAFSQQFRGSSWCQIKWLNSYTKGDESFNRVHITPISPEKLKEHAEIMLDQYRVNEEWYKNHPEVTVPK